jgi:methylated-DNA-[protein]-cysteine S-methyltransferase
VRIETLRYAVPGWGVGELVLSDGRVIQHDLPHQADSLVSLTNDPLIDRLLSYFGGAPVDFSDVPLELDEMTPFQGDVLHALRRVPYGEVVTYGELAALAGYPGAQRAVGTFCAHNRFGLFVPCHRVVAAGGLGSYGSLGIGYKKRLLELERCPPELIAAPRAREGLA